MKEQGEMFSGGEGKPQRKPKRRRKEKSKKPIRWLGAFGKAGKGAILIWKKRRQQRNPNLRQKGQMKKNREMGHEREDQDRTSSRRGRKMEKEGDKLGGPRVLGTKKKRRKLTVFRDQKKKLEKKTPASYIANKREGDQYRFCN